MLEALKVAIPKILSELPGNLRIHRKFSREFEIFSVIFAESNSKVQSDIE
jgi:hypothetical protein